MGHEAEVKKDDYFDVPEFGPEQSSLESVVTLDPDDVEPEPKPEDPVATEPVSTEPIQDTEPKPEPTGTEAEPDKKGKDAEPEPSADALEQIKALEKRLKKSERRQFHLQRQLEKSQKAEQQKTADDEFETELKAKHPEPVEADFEKYEDFQDAKIQWKIDVGVARGMHKQDAKAAESQPEDVQAFVDKTIGDGIEQYSDFQDVVLRETVPITQEIIDAVRTMDAENVNPEDVLYYLGKHPTETHKISRMNPTQVETAIEKIGSSLSKAKAKAGDVSHETPPTKPKPDSKPKSKIKDVSSAAEPIEPTDSTVIIHKDPDKMTQAEYEKWRAGGGGS